MGVIFNIQRYCLHDGSGIRTTIFFKGCPLRCAWCANPESIYSKPQLLVMPSKCIKCKRCLKACKNNALSDKGRDKKKCVVCGTCAKECPTGALEITGEDLTIAEVLKEVLKDITFYNCSNGGITFSGGEPLYQPEYAYSLAKAIKMNYLNLSIETSGYAKWQEIERILMQMDEILYDIKMMDSEKHRQFTGVQNQLILENAEKSSKLGIKMIIRVPLIGGVNDSEENIRDTANFANSIGVKELHLLPYHRFGETKYNKIGKKINTDFYKPEDKWINKLLDIIRSYGIITRSGG
jgi:pyruvate formate lyase activating enzyme